MHTYIKIMLCLYSKYTSSSYSDTVYNRVINAAVEHDYPKKENNDHTFTYILLYFDDYDT